jgi:general secretion pathway protein E
MGLSGQPAGRFFSPGKCPACLNTGYRGRVGIFEILIVDERLRALILERSDSEGIKRFAVSRGMRSILSAGAEKVRAGITSAEEVLRVTQEE